MDDIDKLNHIMASDPNGKPTRPTLADYAAHKAWAIALYGEEVWVRYCRGGWAPTPDA